MRPNSMHILTSLNAAQVQTDGFWLSTETDGNLHSKETEKNHALYFTLGKEDIVIAQEYTTTPKAVYPAFNMKFASLRGIED